MLSPTDSAWHARTAPPEVTPANEALYARLLQELLAAPFSDSRYRKMMRRYRQEGLPWLSKAQLIFVYERLVAIGRLPANSDWLVQLQTKPIRSEAGVAVVTVLTKPYPCPGRCIFCPTDVRMPKSYLHDEPGAQRAERHNFDPYAQTAARLQALARLGHPTDKIELIILGGTWSSYRRDYQEWFVQRCFDALNGCDSADLSTAQQINQSAERRNVGLVVETRQDHIDPDELRWLRRLGVTKVQVGIQSMDDGVLALNLRGHDAAATRRAFRLLRLAGFKIHGHWMANLLGATPASDLADYQRLWDDPAIRPDELKIYPCMLLENSDLYAYWQRGEYTPYDEETVIGLLADCLPHTPPWVRLTRIIRDIPTTNVVAGFKKANLRQLAEQRLAARGGFCRDIRSREIRRETVRAADLRLTDTVYETDATTEHFLARESADNRLAGFLRLSLPHPDQPLPLPELAGHAMIRELHVYGPVVGLGSDHSGEAQHQGLGAGLIAHAIDLARAARYSHIAVISAVGTRHYYEKFGFAQHGLYMTRTLTDN
jgi:elongator complex protein 3